MKYCEKCGAKLEDDALFCDECGTVQSQEESAPPQLKTQSEKSNGKGLIIGIVIVILVLAAAGIGWFVWSQTQPKKAEKPAAQATEDAAAPATKEIELKTETPGNLKDSVKWEDNNGEIEKFKNLCISSYQERSIGQVMTDSFSVNKWQWGKQDKEQYLLCSFVQEKKPCTVIFYKDAYENVNLAEYYLEDALQEKEALQKFSADVFREETFSEDRTGFYTNGKWGMEIVKIDTANKMIEYYPYWWCFTHGRIEQSDTELKKIEIMDADTMGDAEYPIHWSGPDSFTMQKYDCEILFNKNTIGSRDGRSEEFWSNGMGEYKKTEKPADIPLWEDMIPNEAAQTRPAFYPLTPPEGIYYENDAPIYAEYYIDISNVTQSSFDFEIYQAKSYYGDGMTTNFQLVFKHHTAVFEDSNHAVYHGQQYTLRFEITEKGWISVWGFGEVIPDGSPLYNPVYLGVS